jgi:26S proteasome regulatory subunit N13
MMHFAWGPRDTPLGQTEPDLIVFPGDAQFVPYDPRKYDSSAPKINGRVFAFKFSSSPERHLFWLQSKPQAQSGDASWFSPRDLKIGDIVNRLLQGEEVNVTGELAAVQNNRDDSRRDGDDDETMDDVEGHADPSSHHGGGTGGAGMDATGGDPRQEGEGSREGGADGARA